MNSIPVGRRRARELAVQALFHLEYSPNDSENALRLVCEIPGVLEFIPDFSLQLVQGVCDKKDILDRAISTASKHWRIERMARLDRIILRIAAYEMMFLKDIPPRVSMDEAVEIGKKYGGEDSSRYINGVLDKIFRTLTTQVNDNEI